MPLPPVDIGRAVLWLTFQNAFPEPAKSSEHGLQFEPAFSLSTQAGAANMHSKCALNGHLGPGNDKSAAAVASLMMKDKDTNGDGGWQAESPVLGASQHALGLPVCIRLFPPSEGLLPRWPFLAGLPGGQFLQGPMSRRALGNYNHVRNFKKMASLW